LVITVQSPYKVTPVFYHALLMPTSYEKVYRTTRVGASHDMNHTEIYLPVGRMKK